MALQFLHGKNIKTVNPAVKPGPIYLDTGTNELWFDDPNASSSVHNKIIDAATLIYTIESTVLFPSESSTSAVLGTAVLGTMVLG